MSRLYAFVGEVSGELISYRGAVLVHDNPGEMRFLLPMFRVIDLPRVDLQRPLMRLRDHPELAAVSWPLNPREFL